jgi:protein-S-isoprenylcysteine O-methyltransferase Ste14
MPAITLPPMPRRIPRWVGLIVWSALLGALHVAVPLQLSRAGPRHGWRSSGRPRPGPANALGLVPIAAGAGLIGWAVARHFVRASERGWALESDLEPNYLLTDGPYRLSRNPMHVGGLAIWTGWAAWFGSVPITGGAIVLSAVYRAGIAWEERTLERRFGQEWLNFVRTTPRWIGLHRPGARPRA